MIHLICIVGKFASGKDTITAYLNSRYAIPQVCSYTTRPKQKYETDGVRHYFKTYEEFHSIVDREHVIAYTRFDHTGIEYCATMECMNQPIMTYIIDPNGIAYMKQFPKLIAFKSIYVHVPEAALIDRALHRGDALETIHMRLKSEEEQFDAFYQNREYDYLIENDDVQGTYAQIDRIVSKIKWISDRRSQEGVVV